MKELRKIELKDILEIASMLKDFWTSQLAVASDSDVLEDIRRMLDPGCISYLICYDSHIAGLIFVNEKYGYLNNIEYLYIKAEYRGKGLASFALKEIIKQVGAKNNYRVQIEVSPMNIKALKLYHKLGFKYIDTFTLSTSLDGKTKNISINNLDFFVNPKEAFRNK